MAFIQVNMVSECLMRSVNLNVILPVDGIKFPGLPLREEKPFKTLYLLHGIFGSQTDWINGTNIQRWADEYGIAVVMPSGENMFYIDQEKAHNYYGEFIGRELVELTRKMFPLSDKREDTFIGGLSMGGYGALRNGLKYADTFGYVVGLSVANFVDDIDKRTDDVMMFHESRSFAEAVFGDLDKVKNSDKDIKYLAQNLEDALKPKIYIACGTEDVLLSGNHDLRDCFEANGFDVTYEEGPGNHEWDFWNKYIHRVLEWLPVDSIMAGFNSGNLSQLAELD